jgi:hypothetical protein
MSRNHPLPEARLGEFDVDLPAVEQRAFEILDSGIGVPRTREFDETKAFRSTR